MTDERKALLEKEREKARLLTEARASQGAVIDGIAQIEGVQAALDRLRKNNPVPVMAEVGRGGKGKRLAVRR
jgi:hypothetical protein